MKKTRNLAWRVRSSVLYTPGVLGYLSEFKYPGTYPSGSVRTSTRVYLGVPGYLPEYNWGAPWYLPEFKYQGTYPTQSTRVRTPVPMGVLKYLIEYNQGLPRSLPKYNWGYPGTCLSTTGGTYPTITQTNRMGIRIPQSIIIPYYTQPQRGIFSPRDRRYRGS